MNDLVKIHHLEDAMRNMPQAEVETDHYFADGMYARVLKRKAGTLIVGKVHKKEHLYICTRGLVQVYMYNEVKMMSAGDLIVSKPGTKRAVLALEDSICMTVHPLIVPQLEQKRKDRSIATSAVESVLQFRKGCLHRRSP